MFLPVAAFLCWNFKRYAFIPFLKSFNEVAKQENIINKTPKKKQNYTVINSRELDNQPRHLYSCATCGSQMLLCCRRWHQRFHLPLMDGPHSPKACNTQPKNHVLTV